jgi:transposase-like protein
MPLEGNLRLVDLTFNCPHCDRELVKKGGWFQSVRGFKCEGCQLMLRLTYDDKVALVKKHAHRA